MELSGLVHLSSSPHPSAAFGALLAALLSSTPWKKKKILIQAKFLLGISTW